jgi:tetratricopeptide (TPR) repeat protein
MLSIGALLDRLDHRLPLLTGGYRDLPQRQQSMRDTIAWSYDLLQPSEQHLLRWLAVFPGGCSLSSTEALGRALGLTETETLDAVAALFDNALVQRVAGLDGEPRFQLFETMREFGLEQLTATQELSDARFFHATHFLAFAELGAPPPDKPIHNPWLTSAFAERHNLVPAFDRLCRSETAELALRFAAAMGPYWWYMGPFAEGRPRLLRAIALAAAEPTVTEVHARWWTCFLLADAMDLSTALEIAHAGRARAAQIGSARERAIALQALAWVEEHYEHWDVVRMLLDEALQEWIELDNVFMQAMCTMLLGGVEFAKGNLASAERLERGAGELYSDIDEPGWAAGTYWYQGRIATAAGQFGRAAEHFDRCLRIWLRERDFVRWFKPLVGLANVAASIGEMERAARLIGAIDEMLRSQSMGLTPTDTPAYERATTTVCRTIGPERLAALAQAGAYLDADGWLAESSAVVDAARNHQQH